MSTTQRKGTAATVTDGEFALLKDLIHRESGIHLGPGKDSLLVARLGGRLRELGLPSFMAYYERIMGGDAHELLLMLDRIVTNETQFFRERHQFEFLETSVFPEWRGQGEKGTRPKRVTAWSAACSTGEEAYSLAMSLLWHFPRKDGWSVEVLGTDLSTRALEAARTAEWPIAAAKVIPARYLTRYTLRGIRSQIGRMRAGEELCSAVRFERVNLNTDPLPITTTFDLVFARNVLIYFDRPGREAALRRLSGRLASEGYLLLGHAEGPGEALGHLETVRATIYRAPRARGHRSVA
jgi:chemotaxis protein methyltransferase CheR